MHFLYTSSRDAWLTSLFILLADVAVYTFPELSQANKNINNFLLQDYPRVFRVSHQPPLHFPSLCLNGVGELKEEYTLSSIDEYVVVVSH